jgi:hypothetical protein
MPKGDCGSLIELQTMNYTDYAIRLSANGRCTAKYTVKLAFWFRQEIDDTTDRSSHDNAG